MLKACQSYWHASYSSGLQVDRDWQQRSIESFCAEFQIWLNSHELYSNGSLPSPAGPLLMAFPKVPLPLYRNLFVFNFILFFFQTLQKQSVNLDFHIFTREIFVFLSRFKISNGGAARV